MEIKEIISNVRDYAKKCHENAGCTYGNNNENYVVHLDNVANNLKKYKNVFINWKDYLNSLAASYAHDLQEDAQQTYNDVKKATNKETADIVLAVTDVPAESRLLRHMLTLPKTIKDHRAIILKLCDLAANASYGKDVKNSMYKKYKKEWVGYKRYILVEGLKLHENKLNQAVLSQLIKYVDEAHGI